MSFLETFSLIVIMVLLAAIPSTSVALVVTRSATLGVSHGIAVAVGIVLGDLVFIMLAIFGLSVVAETMGGIFMVIKYLGASYLVWLGFSLLKSQSNTRITVSKAREKSNFVTSFLAGFILTLGDVKAIIFYASLFPVFIDMTVLQVADVLAVIFVTVISVGSVKIIYAFSAIKVANFARKLKFEHASRKIAGGLMVGTGTYLIVKA